MGAQRRDAARRKAFCITPGAPTQCQQNITQRPGARHASHEKPRTMRARLSACTSRRGCQCDTCWAASPAQKLRWRVRNSWHFRRACNQQQHAAPRPLQPEPAPHPPAPPQATSLQTSLPKRSLCTLLGVSSQQQAGRKGEGRQKTGGERTKGGDERQEDCSRKFRRGGRDAAKSAPPVDEEGPAAAQQPPCPLHHRPSVKGCVDLLEELRLQILEHLIGRRGKSQIRASIGARITGATTARGDLRAARMPLLNRTNIVSAYVMLQQEMWLALHVLLWVGHYAWPQ